MKSLLSSQHFSSHPQESLQVCQASIDLLHTMRVKVKVALICTVAILVAAIISSCGNGTVQTIPTPTPTLSPNSLNPTATLTPPVATTTVSPGAIFVGDTLVTDYEMGVNTPGGAYELGYSEERRDMHGSS